VRHQACQQFIYVPAKEAFACKNKHLPASFLAGGIFLQ
jgi:hypothetical protein